MRALNLALAAWLGLVLPAPAPAAGLDVDSLLAAPNAPALVDGMKPNERVGVIRDLADALRDRPDTLDVAKLLCVITPWTTGDSATDDAIQTYAWGQMAGLDAQSPRFRWLDCAAVNRTGGYRDTALSPLYDLRQSYCTDLPIAKDLPAYLNNLQSMIEAFNTRVRQGMERATTASGSPRRYSYYPLRNETRIAVLGAARAVAHARAKDDMTAARAEFAATADRLAKAMEVVDFANTRNSWVYHSDLQLLIALYDWLGRGTGPMDLSRLKSWPPALQDPAVAAAIPPTTRARMEKNGETDYVDPVFVERLLPGATAPDEECDGWRRRSFDTRALATRIETCANRLGRPPEDAAELQSLDACIATYQADDWRVQFSSIHPDRTDDGLSAADALVEDLKRTRRFLSLPPDQQKRIAVNLQTFHAEPVSDSYSRIVTNHDLLTLDRQALELMFDDLKLRYRPLTARKKIY